MVLFFDQRTNKTYTKFILLTKNKLILSPFGIISDNFLYTETQSLPCYNNNYYCYHNYYNKVSITDYS